MFPAHDTPLITTPESRHKIRVNSISSAVSEQFKAGIGVIYISLNSNELGIVVKIPEYSSQPVRGHDSKRTLKMKTRSQSRRSIDQVCAQVITCS